MKKIITLAALSVIFCAATAQSPTGYPWQQGQVLTSNSLNSAFSARATFSSGDLTLNGILLGNGSGDIKPLASFGSIGQVLTSNGAGAAPTWTSSSFDAAHIAIVGGSINGTLIGNTSPNSGAFTTLTLGTPLSIANGGTGNTSGTATSATTATTATTAINQNGGTVSATTITATTGAITPHYPDGIIGNATGSAVTAGRIGEIKSDTGTSVSLSTSTETPCASVNLSAGTWLIIGNMGFNVPGVSTITSIAAGINNSTALPPPPYYSFYQGLSLVGEWDIPSPSRIINTVSSGTYYIMGYAVYVGNPVTMTCFITAVRVG